jgi:hypothetical protein
MLRRTFFWITVFSIAMAFLESAVVVYLRALYYPEGFAFPLKEMDSTLALTELIREAATMVMLASVAVLSSRKVSVGVAWFIYAFAIWDIFYYVFLWLLIGWPQSFFTWDILFLLPVMWTGPVLAPVINSLTMILLAALIVRVSERHEMIRLKGVEWILLIAGSVITIIGYTEDYMHYMLRDFSFTDLVSFRHYNEVMAASSVYVPQHFSWWIFATGELFFLVAIAGIRRRIR